MPACSRTNARPPRARRSSAAPIRTRAACTSTPSAHVAAPLVELFAPKDPHDLGRAIERALATPGDSARAAELSARLRWDEVFEAERTELERLFA